MSTLVNQLKQGNDMMTDTDKFRTLAQFVMDYAMAHYNKDGWDYIVECNSVSELETELAEEGIKTKAGALQFYRDRAEVLNDRRADVQSGA